GLTRFSLMPLERPEKKAPAVPPATMPIMASGVIVHPRSGSARAITKTTFIEGECLRQLLTAGEIGVAELKAKTQARRDLSGRGKRELKKQPRLGAAGQIRAQGRAVYRGALF